MERERESSLSLWAILHHFKAGHLRRCHHTANRRREAQALRVHLAQLILRTRSRKTDETFNPTIKGRGLKDSLPGGPHLHPHSTFTPCPLSSQMFALVDS
jgi:hypothetical protein